MGRDISKMDLSDQILRTGIDQVLKIAEERKALITNLKDALISDEIEKIKRYARILCGLDGGE